MSRKKKGDGKPIARNKPQYTVYNVNKPAELMSFLMENMAGISRTSVKAMLSNRRVYVDNHIVTAFNFALKPGVQVKINKKKSNKEFHSNLLKLLYEDAYLLVVEKKEGLLPFPAAKGNERSAQSILLEYVKRTAKERQVYVVHPLDREASGLMIFAKDEKTRNTLQDYWEEFIISQRFVAVLNGETEKDNGIVTSWTHEGKVYVSFAPLETNNINKITTRYQTIKRRNGYSLVEVEPDNGRRNHVRMHMADLKHPILGDKRNGSAESPLRRMALHAFKLDFHHPVTSEKLKFETPYPASFKELMTRKEES